MQPTTFKALLREQAKGISFPVLVDAYKLLAELVNESVHPSSSQVKHIMQQLSTIAARHEATLPKTKTRTSEERAEKELVSSLLGLATFVNSCR